MKGFNLIIINIINFFTYVGYKYSPCVFILEVLLNLFILSHFMWLLFYATALIMKDLIIIEWYSLFI